MTPPVDWPRVITTLRSRDLTDTDIGAAAGISRNMVWKLANRYAKDTQHAIGQRILALLDETADHTPTDWGVIVMELRRHMKQQDIAKAIGCSPNTLSLLACQPGRRPRSDIGERLLALHSRCRCLSR